MINGIGAISDNPFTQALERAAAPTKTETQGASLDSFGDVMASLATDMSHNIKRAETVSTDAILGKASLREVADAVMTADRTLQTAIAFRDKIVSAYLEVIKMPI